MEEERESWTEQLQEGEVTPKMKEASELVERDLVGGQEMSGEREKAGPSNARLPVF